MKKIFLLLFILPSFVFASELICDDGVYKLDDTFNCRISMGTSNTFEEIKGKLNVPKYLDCSNITYGDGITPNKDFSDYEFNVKGIGSKNILSFKCKVTSNVDSSVKGSISINNFSYSGVTEVLRSNSVTIVPTDTSSKGELPRDTSKTNLQIENITFDNIKFTFSRFISEYSLEVDNSIDSINPIITLVDSTSTFEIDKKNLDVGDNKINIIVTNKDGDKNAYTLNIKRLNEGEKPYVRERDSSVKNIEITGISFNFDENIHSYELLIDDIVNNLNINVVPNVDTSSVTISGNSNLKNKSKIIISVKSENGENESKYVINIKKRFDIKENKNYIIGGIIGIVVFILLIVIIVTNNRSNKKKKRIDIKDKIEVVDL